VDTVWHIAKRTIGELDSLLAQCTYEAPLIITEDETAHKMRDHTRKIDSLDIYTHLAQRGLIFESGFLYNGYDLTGEIDPGDNRSRLYAGVRWRLLRHGFAESRIGAENTLLEAQIDSIENSLLSYGFSGAAITAMSADFYRNRYILLAAYHRFLERLEKIGKELYYNGDLQAHKYQRVQKDIFKTQKRMVACSTFVFLTLGETPMDTMVALPATEDPESSEIVRLADSLSRVVPLFDSLTEMQSVLKDHISLRAQLDLQVKYNVYREERFYHGPSAGITFSLPIQSPLQKKEKSLQEKLLRKTALEARLASLKFQCISLLQSIDMINAKVANAQFKRDMNRSHLQRRESQNVTGGKPMDSFTAYSYVRDIFDAELEVLELRRLKAEKLLALARVLHVDTISQYSVKADTDTLQTTIRKGKRWIYCWAKTVNTTNSDFLIQFLKVKEISGVYIAWSKSIPRDSLKSFVTKAHAAGLRTQLMLHNISYLQPGNFTDVITAVEFSNELGMEGIHLDIEPHQEDNWRENDYSLLHEYSAFVQRVRNFFQGPLTAAIPVMYPRTVLEKLAPYLDRVVLMSYGIKTLEDLERRCEDEFQIFNGRYSIGVRCSDFVTERLMEQYIDKVYTRVQNRYFAIHNCREYLTLVAHK